MSTKLLGTFTALLLFTSILQSQTRPRESLRGLDGVYLYVQPVGKDVEAGGLSTVQIQKAVEKQLHEAGIPIHSEPNPANGSANLAIIVDTLKHPQGAYLYDVEVSLLQEVHLARRQDLDSFPAQTWSAKAMGLTVANRMDLMIEPLKAKVADFVADYLAVNPKTHP
ncbi:MAG TPA: hypothetical protein VNW47_05280 [Terriglobales bacterium]|jgi:hypothetical protein|nr:hypothetical protein [Terriglobales bacterium]